mmetsp:Transcript_22544/g.48999  ORF Transcript_22544/g.48999 Transcript_22544/m.48999 type:complete len:96 (+) Transcript_22544:189-476(+)
MPICTAGFVPEARRTVDPSFGTVDEKNPASRGTMDRRTLLGTGQRETSSGLGQLYYYVLLIRENQLSIGVAVDNTTSIHNTIGLSYGSTHAEPLP